VTGVRDRDGTVSLEVGDSGPRGFLAIHDGADRSVLTSTDGRRWSQLAPLPTDWECCGGGALFWAGDIATVASDSSKEEGGVGCGNRLGVWRLEPGGTWEEVVDRQASVVYGAASDGATVILTGQGWCTAPDWGWTLVSTDGGRTWDPDLSWTGRSGTCVSDVAIDGGIAVIEGCAEGEPSLWRAELVAVAPVEPSPTAAPEG
jgi:hypothetical protein